MRTMLTSLRNVLVDTEADKGPFRIKRLASGQLRYYVRPYVNGRQRTVAVCDSENEAQAAYKNFLVTRAWQAFPPLSPAQQERLNYYAHTTPAARSVLQRLLMTFVQPIPVVPDKRGQHITNLRRKGTR